MSDKSRALFHDLATKLTAEGRLKHEDIEQLAMYCQAVEMYAQATETLRQEGPLIVQEYNGHTITKRHPAFDIQTMQYNIIKHASKQFGLSPYDRKLVGESNEENQQPDEEFPL